MNYFASSSAIQLCSLFFLLNIFCVQHLCTSTSLPFCRPHCPGLSYAASITGFVFLPLVLFSSNKCLLDAREYFKIEIRSDFVLPYNSPVVPVVPRMPSTSSTTSLVLMPVFSLSIMALHSVFQRLTSIHATLTCRNCTGWSLGDQLEKSFLCFISLFQWEYAFPFQST